MAESEYRFRPQATLKMSNDAVHVPDNIFEARNTLLCLRNSGDHVIAELILDAMDGRVVTLEEKQDAMSGGASDRKEIRNNAYALVFGDHKNNMLAVQLKSNDIVNFNSAAAFIKRNGYGIAEERSAVAHPDITIKAKPNYAGTIIAEVKAPDTTKNFSIDWEYSYDNGETWFHSNSTGVCDREISGLKLLSTVIVRARFIIGYDAPTDWMRSNEINI